MKKCRLVWAAACLMLMLGNSRAQTDAGQQSSDNSQQQGTAPPANQPQLSSESPPISGLDAPSLESRIPSRSFLVPGIHVSESVDSNVGENTGNSSTNAVTRALGSLMLQKIGNRYLTALDYVGGVAYYSRYHPSNNQIHQFDGEQKILWRRGQLALRDQFSYLPEGAFGFGIYGESSAYNLGLTGINYAGGTLGAGLGGIFSLGEFGSLGQQPRITNTAIVDLSEALSPRSTVTVAGGYGLIHFTNNAAGFIDSNQVTAQVGYDYHWSRKDQIALVYGFQDFHYPNIPGSSFSTHLVNLMYGHHISGRMDLILGAGPQVTLVNNSLLLGGSSEKITASAQASLRYRFPRTSLGISYNRYDTSGSGYFLGAVSDIVRFWVSRPLSRVWTLNSDIGYSFNSQIQHDVLSVVPSSTTSFQYLYAGAALQRQLGRNFGLFFSYQFNDLSFNSLCTVGQSCNNGSQRHVAAVGLDWRSHPIRLD